MNRRSARGIVAGLSIAGLAMMLNGCDTVGYYTQALRGQAEIWRAARPIDAVLADPRAPQTLRDRLALANEMREFATRELGLPDNGSYRQFADLKRPYVVWNVFAAEPYAVKPIQWCFPVAGCVAYKGYFARADADRFAAQLRGAGKDVFVSGVPAYSTLGYFDDPVLNTFIHYPPAELSRLIFHELAHQVVYVRDDSVFNESFAVTVEREGVRRWITHHGLGKELEKFDAAQARRQQFFQLVGRYRLKLEALYATHASETEKADAKRALFAALAQEYAELKAAWGGFKGYDAWLGPDANNATLASISVYTQQVPAFQALLDDARGDLPRFYAAVRALSALAKPERDARLDELRNKARTTASESGHRSARE